MKKLWCVSLTVPSKLAESFASGLEETAEALTILAPPRKDHAKIEVLYAEEPDEIALKAHLAMMALLQNVKDPKLQIQEVPALDWLAKVAGDFPPLPIARWTIHGAHHKSAVQNRRYALQIDATSAFGTGEHPTTQGCLLMLDELLKKKLLKGLPRMLDMGCGSGILAMSFLKAQRGRAVAVDLDLDSVHVARENQRVNGLRNRMRVGLSYGYQARLVKQNAPYSLIMSNIFARPLCHMAKNLKQHLSPGGIAILSGLLTHQANAVLAAHRMQKIYLLKRLTLGEWTILALRHDLKAHSDE